MRTTWLSLICSLATLAASAADAVEGPFKSVSALVDPEKDGVCLRYNASKRTGSRLVSRPDGIKVPVDVGIVGYGVKAYLSFSSDVVVVDGATDKTLWAKFVGAAYGSLSFAQARDSKTEKDMVLLRTGARDGTGRFFEIMTGSEKFLTKDEKGLVASDEEEKELRGRPLDLGRQFSGDDSKIEIPQCVRITSPDEWKKVWSSHTGEKDAAPDIDFAKDMAVAVFHGQGKNCKGISLLQALDCGDAIELFVRGRYYQTGAEGKSVAAYGIFVAPKSAKKLIVKEDCQGLIGGPPIWKIVGEFKPLDGNAQPDGPANGSQPICSDTNSTPSAAGSRR